MADRPIQVEHQPPAAGGGGKPHAGDFHRLAGQHAHRHRAERGETAVPGEVMHELATLEQILLVHVRLGYATITCVVLPAI